MVNRPIFVARELTKIHEELIWASPNDLLQRFENPHGEFTLIIPPGSAAAEEQEIPSDAEIAELVGHITEVQQPKSLKEASRLAGERLGLSAREVYAAVERTKVGR